MFIKSLTIKNFRCFGKDGITADLNKGLTAFIGRNGSGKTSILEALNFLIGHDYLPTRISEKDFHNEAKEIKDEIFIEGETESPFFITLDVRSSTNQLETIIIPCNKIRLTIKRREKPEKVLDDPFIINKYVVPVVGDIDEGIFKAEEKDRKASRINQIKEGYTVFYKLKDGQERDAKVIGYQLTYNPSRLTNCPKAYYLTKDRDDDVSSNYSLISKILTDLHWKYKKKHTAGDGATIQGEYDTLAGSLRSIVDEKGALIRGINEKVKSICSDDKDFQIDFIDIDQPYKSAFVAKKEGDKLLLPDNLGSGFNILIAYALFAYVAELEKIPIVLIVDEPELHLHSDWQKKMYDVFTKQTNLQIVYSTQSENFISLKNWRQIKSIADFQIFPKAEVLQEQVAATDGQTGTRAEYLDDYATRNLHISTILRENLELFFTKKCVLVEGPSEKYALPKLLKLSSCDIEEFSVSIIIAWGKTKIKNYQMICKVFDVDYFTLFDQDKAEDDEPATENSAIESNVQTGKLAKFSTSFEAKLGITGEGKFQKLVKIIDETTDTSSLDQEIKDTLASLETFIKS
jgi:AAA15 family ATPase/GTPase